jgi:hypothetical protein
MSTLELGVGNRRLFSRPRPSVGEVHFLAQPAVPLTEEAAELPGAEVLDADERREASRFQNLPAPTGNSPYRLSLESVVAADVMSRITEEKKLVFHAAGDTGGMYRSNPADPGRFQHSVAEMMEMDFDRPQPVDRPAFFYHLGDVVYFRGEAEYYYPEFYEPYEHYPAPIFAIPGNHDGEAREGVPSLNAFVRNFCAREPHRSPDALDVPRQTMTQPNVYFTLRAPLATIIGLYSNVPEGGEVRADQAAWFRSELEAAPADRALFVAVHHPLFSADTHHSGSPAMKDLVEQAIAATGRVPDLFLHGHVHNYQRFTWRIRNREVPVIVAGAGGYPNLHSVGLQQGRPIHTPFRPEGSDATLESYVDRLHGFLRLEVTSNQVVGKYYTPSSVGTGRGERRDLFRLSLTEHRLIG